MLEQIDQALAPKGRKTNVLFLFGAKKITIIKARYYLMYEDKTLKCKDCGEEFVFTAGEQEFYAERGFQNEPQRCKACRDARKNAVKPQRELFITTCANCGKEAKVPFQPSNDRPVYCSECYAAMKQQ